MDHTERLIRRVLTALALHPGLAGGGERRTEALLVYARRAVGIGAPFDADTLDELGPLSPEDIVTASGNLPDKLSAEAREDHARRAQEGGQEGQATVERFFEGRQSVVRALLLDGPGLAERVRTALDRHNAAAESGTATGRYGRWRARGGLDDKGLVELEALDRSSTQKKRASEVLASAREWELADDLERAAAPAAQPPARGNPDAHLASRKPIQAWGAIGPASFAIVYSRDPRLVGECSTGQRWTNCFTENNSNFESVGAHIQHGAIVAYLVDRDDPVARYPHLRVLLTPMGGVDRNGMRSGEERVFGESRTFGSLGYGGATITERFRQSVLDAARLLSGGLHGQFHTVRGIPFSDAGGQRFRISEWTPNDLRSEIERTIERRDPGRSLQDHVDLKRRLSDALERRGDRALRDDVDRLWGRFAMARQTTDALAGAVGREDVRKLVTDLRDRSFALMPDGMQQLPQAAAMQAMRPVLDDFLKMHPMPAAATTALDIDAVLLAAASPVVGGDVICAALLASLEGGPRGLDVPFELCGELPCHLRTLQVRRWQHLSGVAADWSDRAVAERDGAVEAKERLPDDLGVSAIHDAFQGAWFSLRVRCGALGPRAWDRLRAAALREGVGTAMDEVQRPRSRILGTDLLVLAVLMRRSMGTRLRDVQAAARHARAEVAHRWEAACALFEASPLAGGVPDRDSFLMALLEGGRVPRPYSEGDGALATLGRRHGNTWNIDQGNRGRQLLAEVLFPAAFEAARAGIDHARTKIKAAEDWRRDPTRMPGWLGASAQDAEVYCWLSDPGRLQKKFTATNRDLHVRIDPESVARQVHRWIRYNVAADLPDPGKLVAAVRKCLAERFPEYIDDHTTG